MNKMTWNKIGWWDGTDFGQVDSKKYKCPKVALMGGTIIGRNNLIYTLTSFEADGQRITFKTAGTHGFTVGQLAKISGLTAEVSKVFAVETVPDTNTFTVLSDYSGPIEKLFATSACAIRIGYRSCGFAALATARFKQDGEARLPFELHVSSACPGSKTSDILERMDYELIPHNPDVVIFMGGDNDTDGDQTLANIRAIHKKLQDNQIDMWLCSLTPVTSAYAGAVAKNESIRKVNMRLRKFAVEVGIPFFDMYSALANEDGMGISEYYSDTVHPYDLGHHAMAEVLLDFLKQNVEGRNSLPVTKSDDNIYPDPMFDSTTTVAAAGVTGVRPVNSTYLFTAFSGLSSITPHIDEVKNWQSDLYWTPESTNTMVRMTASNINLKIEKDCLIFSEYLANFEAFENRKARIAFCCTYNISRNGVASSYTDYSITNGQVPGDGEYYVSNTPCYLKKGDILTTMSVSAQLIAMDDSGTCRLNLRQCRMWQEDAPSWIEK